MSTDQGAPEGAAAQPEKKPVSPQFVDRMNQFLRLANRLERRYDSQHATLVFLHAFARFSAHHYLAKVKADTSEERKMYADYMSAMLAQVTHQNMDDLIDFGQRVAAHRAAREQAGAAPTDATGAE